MARVKRGVTSRAKHKKVLKELIDQALQKEQEGY